jgi:hypothetical protein
MKPWATYVLVVIAIAISFFFGMILGYATEQNLCFKLLQHGHP